MATSKGLTSAYVPEATPEAISANQQYNEAMRKLVESLDSRKNRLFDPTLLAMAEGFLSPTKTGGFGESLGIAAGKVRAAEEEETKRDIEDARARMEVAQLGAQMERQRQLDAPFQRMFSTQGAPSRPAQAGRPAAPSDAVGSATPADSTPIVAKYGASSDGRRIMDPQPLPDKNEFFLTRRAQGIPFADVEKQWLEILNKDVEMRDGYIFQRSTGMAFDLKEDVTPTPIQLRTVPGTGSFMVSGVLARDHNRLLRKAMESGDPAALAQLREFERRLIQTFPAEEPKISEPAKSGEPAKSTDEIDKAVNQFSGQFGARTATGRVPTAAESEASAAAAKEQATLQAKSRVERTNAVFNEAKDAAASQPDYEQLKAMAEDPSNAKIWGAFTNRNVVDQLVKLASSGVSVGPYRIGVAELEDIARKYKFTKDEMSAFQVAFSLMTKLQLAATNSQKGSVSDFERTLFAAAGITVNDTPETIRTKVGIALRTSQYKQELADALESSGMQYDQFVRTPQGRQMFRKFVTDTNEMLRTIPKQAVPSQTSGTRYQIREAR